jgi:hypothetical protein
VQLPEDQSDSVQVGMRDRNPGRRVALCGADVDKTFVLGQGKLGRDRFGSTAANSTHRREKLS